MKLLFLTSRLPFPPDRGDRLRTYQFLRQFSREHHVTLVSFISDEKERLLADNLSDYCDEMVLVPLAPWESLVNVALNVWRSLPMQTLFYQSHQMEKRVEDLLAATSFDVAYVHLFRMAPYLAHHPEIYRILDLTDLISHELQASIPFQSVPWQLIYRFELPRIVAYEQQISRLYDETWFISHRDRELFYAQSLQPNSMVVPNGIDEEFFTLSRDLADPRTLLFIGHLEVRHNIDAATFMAEEIMPIILQEVPGCKFLIAGAGSTHKVRKLERFPGVKVIGYVPDLKTVFSACAISVAPLRFSAGMQNKVVQSLASGLPVVTTSEVSDGLGTLQGRDLLVADDALTFAAQLLRLLKDEDLREGLGRAGRAYVKANFSSRPAIDRLKTIGYQIKD